jgi:hypothetical protein
VRVGIDPCVGCKIEDRLLEMHVQLLHDIAYFHFK